MGWISLKNWTKLPPTKQKTANSCWAACGSALSNYFADSEGKGTARDQDAVAQGIGADINKVASMEAVLAFIGCYAKAEDVEVDEANLPDRQEIAKELLAGRPIVVGINDAELKNPKTDQLKDGHYMIIIGVEDSNGQLWIMVLRKVPSKYPSRTATPRTAIATCDSPKPFTRKYPLEIIQASPRAHWAS
jgi:hypothetical protein